MTIKFDNISSNLSSPVSHSIDRNELLELEILKKVEKTSFLSHRMLATYLGCNLRLTHALMTKLLSRGWLEVQKLNSREWHYFLTPSGVAAKLQKTYHFLEFSMSFYDEVKKKSSEIGGKLTKKGIKDIAFIGCGNVAEIAFMGISEWDITLLEVYGDAGKIFIGHKVLPFSQLKDSKANALLVCIYDRNHHFFTSEHAQDQRIHNIF